MKKRNLYEIKKLQHNTKMRLKEFSSFTFISFFEDEEILTKVRGIFQYDIPVSYKKSYNLSDIVYCEWLYTLLDSMALSTDLVVLLDGVRLWCNIKVISYTDFSREMIRLNPNRDFTIIDVKKQVVVDFSSGETEYEIRILNYML